ncbi:MAG: hypothetical protein AAFN78_14040 [Pseudomonadota bacterium]
MTARPTSGTPARRNALGAAAALGLGALVYVTMRDHLPAVLPGWLSTVEALSASRALVPDWLTGPLPSFAHAAAVLLLTAAVAGRTRLARGAMALSLLLCLALELVQHPVVNETVAAWTGAAGLAPDRLLSYAAHGTFDHYDVAAVVLAAVVAHWLVTRPTPSKGETE